MKMSEGASAAEDIPHNYAPGLSLGAMAPGATVVQPTGRFNWQGLAVSLTCHGRHRHCSKGDSYNKIRIERDATKDDPPR